MKLRQADTLRMRREFFHGAGDADGRQHLQRPLDSFAPFRLHQGGVLQQPRRRRLFEISVDVNLFAVQHGGEFRSRDQFERKAASLDLPRRRLERRKTIVIRDGEVVETRSFREIDQSLRRKGTVGVIGVNVKIGAHELVNFESRRRLLYGADKSVCATGCLRQGKRTFY